MGPDSRRLEAGRGRAARDRAWRRLAVDTTLMATLLGALFVVSCLADPASWLVQWAQEPRWGIVGRVIFFLALSHVVMFFFGARRGADLKRELAQRRAAEARLRHLADHDDLTGLPTRTSYLRTLSARTDAGQPAVVVQLDLDRFKEINDTLGHHVGDVVLRAVAARMAAALPPDGSLARLGGDEFALLLPDADPDDAVRAVLDAVRAPLTHDGSELELGASAGIAHTPQHGTAPSELLRRADLAMYAAKAARQGLVHFTPELEEASRERFTLRSDLRKALGTDAVYLVFQPKVALAAGRVVGVEALVRWNHPDHGVLQPARFVPLAESGDLIGPLTDAVLDLALAACAQWQAAGLALPVAVNLSARNLLDETLPLRVAARLDTYGLDPQHLEFEVTESAAMTDPARAVESLRALTGLGVRLSVDDFGTGHASLAHLSRLPVHSVKIDSSFVEGMDGDRTQRMIVDSTVRLAHDLGLTVVAEGVATDAAWQLLAATGCDHAQGHWLCSPVPLADLAAAVSGLEHRLGEDAGPMPHRHLPRPVGRTKADL